MLDVKLSIEVFEYLVVKLSTIINNNGMGKSKSAYDRFLEVLDFALDDVCQRLFLHHLVK